MRVRGGGGGDAAHAAEGAEAQVKDEGQLLGALPEPTARGWGRAGDAAQAVLHVGEGTSLEAQKDRLGQQQLQQPRPEEWEERLALAKDASVE